jgi:hypothetical protein
MKQKPNIIKKVSFFLKKKKKNQSRVTKFLFYKKLKKLRKLNFSEKKKINHKINRQIPLRQIRKNYESIQKTQRKLVNQQLPKTTP